MSTMAKDRLKALCLSLEHVVPFDIADPSALTAAIDAVNKSSDEQSVFDNMNASMSNIRAHVTGTKSLDGEAQIVLARGKKRHIYDFNMTLDFEVTVEPASIPGGGSSSAESDSTDDSSKKAAKKYKGTLQFQEISPNCTIEPVVKFKKEVPYAVEKRVKLAIDGLKSKVCESIRAFESEFKDM